MKPPTGRPCIDCPWRRRSGRGWLGPHTAEEWVEIAHMDGPIACHLTIPGREEQDMTACSGAAIYRANVCKIPRGFTREQLLPEDHKFIFSTPTEFRRHHEGGT